MINKFERVVLTIDLPGKKLKKGDVGTVVMIYPLETLASMPATGYEIEFFTTNGNTFAVETLLPNQIRPVKTNEVNHVREVA